MNYKKISAFIFPALILIVYYIGSNKYFGYFCPSQAIIGIPCPACGMTRAALLFAKGNFRDSFNMHPLFIPAAILICLYFIFKIFRPQNLKYLYMPGVILIISSFFLLLYRVLFDFGNEPIVLNPNSAMRQIYEIFR